ncbi:biopolymer transporter ExbD [Oscillatoria amoena NRMC-F 0135]|nr:MAG: biopolymer transporter ExbD [Bacteroidota bacterium]MDL5048455.1 biopolymer transporter ExbD [Oscillatoria amoena NRMC-F 0135]
MAKFKKKKSTGSAPISTASLPDIVFMLLFFFMVTTTLREVTLKVKNNTPMAEEVEKLERKSATSFIYVGPPADDRLGTASRIQLNDQLAYPSQIPQFLELEKTQIHPVDLPKFSVSLKADKEAKMGTVVDVKQELRKTSVFKIYYSAKKRNTGPGL